ncbi:hypothetical protein ACLI09_15710 [Flavobacterium sp. RHBU_24]|uniref:hypothetical protein n=1 Tax=Flavobacterium sp. RHBU_24 TaxID=3391185 RepID=UPI0039852519
MGCGKYISTFKDDTATTTIDCDMSFPEAVLDMEHRNILLKVAENCPVSKILKGDTKVRSFIYYNVSEPDGKQYSGENITISWKPSLCQHSGVA